MGLPVPGLVVAGLLMLVGGLLLRRSSGIQTLVVASAAGVLVATCTWWLAGLSERAPVVGGVVTMNGSASLSFPGDGTEPEERRKVGYETCASQSVESLARLLDDLTGGRAGPKTKVTAEAVARGYAEYFREPALYEGCLQGFRDRR